MHFCVSPDSGTTIFAPRFGMMLDCSLYICESKLKRMLLQCVGPECTGTTVFAPRFALLLHGKTMLSVLTSLARALLERMLLHCVGEEFMSTAAVGEVYTIDIVVTAEDGVATTAYGVQVGRVAGACRGTLERRLSCLRWLVVHTFATAFQEQCSNTVQGVPEHSTVGL